MNYLDELKQETFRDLCARATEQELKLRIKPAIETLEHALGILISAGVPMDRVEVQLLKTRIQNLKEYTGPVAKERRRRKPLELAASPPMPAQPEKTLQDILEEFDEKMKKLRERVTQNENLKRALKRKGLRYIRGKKTG